MQEVLVVGEGTETFAERLSRALKQRGMGLRQVSEQLAERGHPAAPSTLSQWSNGRNRPQRRQVEAGVLEALEQVLGTEPGHLSGAVMQTATDTSSWWRLRGVPDPSRELGALVRAVCQEFGLPESPGLRRLMLHETVHLDAEGCVTRVTCRNVVQAERDGVERFLHSTFADPLGDGLLSLRQTRMRSGARLGRSRAAPEMGLVIDELILDRTLSTGDVLVLEYDVFPLARLRAEDCLDHELRSLRPIGMAVIGAEFDPARLPSSISQASGHRLDLDLDMTTLPATPVPLQGTVATAGVKGLDRGGLRLEWCWEER